MTLNEHLNVSYFMTFNEHLSVSLNLDFTQLTARVIIWYCYWHILW